MKFSAIILTTAYTALTTAFPVTNAPTATSLSAVSYNHGINTVLNKNVDPSRQLCEPGVIKYVHGVLVCINITEINAAIDSVRMRQLLPPVYSHEVCMKLCKMPEFFYIRCDSREGLEVR
jgi:hypothetical protein